MNKFYVVFPTLLLIAFGVYYTQVAKPQMAEQERIEAQKIEDQKAADEVRRQQIEDKARMDAVAQQQAREAKDKEKQERLQREKDEQDRKVKEETEKFEAEAASVTKQIADMDKEIVNLRAQREQLGREVYESAAKVELAKTDRDNADLEIQRMYDMVAQKVGDSFLTKLPPPPPPK